MIEIKFFKVPTLLDSIVVAFFHSYNEVCVMGHAERREVVENLIGLGKKTKILKWK